MPVTVWGIDKRVMLLVAGIIGISIAYVLLLSVAESTVVQVQGDLTSHWQTSYDLLVRAPGHHLPEEINWEMVRVNYLSNIPPSITNDQYQVIRQIPGVAVAAPVSMVGYFYDRARRDLDRPSPGLYRLDWQSDLDTGLQVLHQTNSRYLWTYAPQEASVISSTAIAQGNPPFIVIEPSSPFYDSPTFIKFTYPILLAGIDPEAEAALAGLDQAIVEGEMLASNFPHCIYPPLQDNMPRRRPLPPGSNHASVFLIPVIARQQLPQNLETELTVTTMSPPAAPDLMKNINSAGRSFLDSLPVAEISPPLRLSLGDIYPERLQYWLGEGDYIRHQVAQGHCRPDLTDLPPDVKQALESASHPWGEGVPLWPLPSAIQYQEETATGSLVAFPVPAPLDPRQSELNPFNEQLYRMPAKEIIARVSPLIVGTFDESELGALTQELIRVPLETYYQVQATAHYDDQENNLSQPLPFLPGMTPLGYLQSPPAMLTNLDAACAILGEPCISAIRVRVEGAGQFTPQAQARLEAVASEIIRNTGLEVDIVTGSSPAPTSVLLPNEKDGHAVFLEELWVRKNVHLNIKQRVQQGSHLLLALLIVMAVTYTYNASEMWIWQRAQKWATMRAVGWRTSTLMAYLLSLGIIIGGLAGGIGLLVGWGIKITLGLNISNGKMLWIMPLSVMLLLAGMLLPVWRIGRLPVSSILRERTTYHFVRKPVSWLFARHRQQAVAGLVVVSGASLLSTVVGGGLLGMRGYLQLTLLGQYILMKVQNYHWMMAVLGGCLSALAVLDINLLAVQRNQVMIGVLKATGWRTRHILIFWVRQGATLGLLGGAIGSVVGTVLLVTSAKQWDIGYGLAALITVMLCTMVSAAAALWPAFIAARYSVTDVLRET